ncbi:hypothetical protein Tco_1032241 [Tanacetum coccineum]|uniref:Uncharacterized protein n=1 Tax=Tanacetum coccineum TaxID=301880 RepID=A0ABQ5GBU3_9ASTR
MPYYVNPNYQLLHFTKLKRIVECFTIVNANKLQAPTSNHNNSTTSQPHTEQHRDHFEVEIPEDEDEPFRPSTSKPSRAKGVPVEVEGKKKNKEKEPPLENKKELVMRGPQDEIAFGRNVSIQVSEDPKNV